MFWSVFWSLGLLDFECFWSFWSFYPSDLNHICPNSCLTLQKTLQNTQTEKFIKKQLYIIQQHGKYKLIEKTNENTTERILEKLYTCTNKCVFLFKRWPALRRAKGRRDCLRAVCGGVRSEALGLQNDCWRKSSHTFLPLFSYKLRDWKFIKNQTG